MDKQQYVLKSKCMALSNEAASFMVQVYREERTTLVAELNIIIGKNGKSDVCFITESKLHMTEKEHDMIEKIAIEHCSERLKKIL